MSSVRYSETRTQDVPFTPIRTTSHKDWLGLLGLGLDFLLGFYGANGGLGYKFGSGYAVTQIRFETLLT